jgi:hypothetical protein
VSAPRFDGASVWATLTQEAQAAIGAAALDHAAVTRCADAALDEEPMRATPFSRAAETGMCDLADALFDIVAAHVPAAAFDAPDGWPMLPQALGQVCRACGCSQFDACSPACGWAEEDLCTACVGQA